MNLLKEMSVWGKVKYLFEFQKIVKNAVYKKETKRWKRQIIAFLQVFFKFYLWPQTLLKEKISRCCYVSLSPGVGNVACNLACKR